MKINLFSIALFVYVGCYTQSALAVNDKMCQFYGSSAIKENDRNIQLSCNLGGPPRWASGVTGLTGHVGWCSGTGLNQIENEEVVRLEQLDSCNHEAMCEQYTQNAMEASKWNRDLKCGGTGPRYESTEEGHRNWCLGAQQKFVMGEMRARYEDLDLCTTCDHYASEAIHYNKMQADKGCKLSGPRWSSEREGHFRWCMGTKLSVTVEEQNVRAREAVDCRNPSLSDQNTKSQKLESDSGKLKLPPPGPGRKELKIPH